jgi:ATP-dependent Clp protease ATP-binding subunit ClpA/ATP-dependent Clp protease ATP-binding subunit ClpC
MQITIPVYQEKEGAGFVWSTLGLGHYTRHYRGTSRLKLQQRLSTELKALIESVDPSALPSFEFRLGTSLERVHLELTLYGDRGRRKLSGVFPLILEPRWSTEDHKLILVYHPARQGEWFPLSSPDTLASQATSFFQKKWADLDDDDLMKLRSGWKDSIFSISFSATPRSLLDTLPKRSNTDDRATTKPAPSGAYQVLPKLGLDLTPRAASSSLPAGLPRAPYREQLQLLLCGPKKKPVVLLGPSGVGKSTLRNRLVHDLLAADGYQTHRNLDRVTRSWLLSGKRLIAGMSYVGDWEARCLSLVEDARRKPSLLIFEDLHLFGRLGRARDSERSFADFFRGPLSRGELMILGESTQEQWQQLEEDAPSFAALFTPVVVNPTDPPETLRLLLSEARALELAHNLRIGPYALRAIIELGGPLSPGSAAPGQALELLRQLAKDEEGNNSQEPLQESAVISLLSRRTGLPELLLDRSLRLDPGSLHDWMSRRVMGQPAAIEAACDLVSRVKAGLTDAKRPFAVYLLTGPTGTGKTELAKCIAAYLYRDPARLLRLDMGEFSGYDAAARLIGDRYAPEGILTRQVHEQPFSVILFDEIEKAHPSVLHLLLQLFDEGRLTDAAGVTADFTRTVLLMTSNLGATPRAPSGFVEEEASRMLDIARAVREFFPPELFNRIDRVVPFGGLSRPVASLVAEKELSRLLGRHGLAERGAFVQLTPTAREHITQAAFHPKDGARALKRAIEEQVGGLLVEALTQGAPGVLRLYQLYEQGGALRLHGEVMREHQARPGRYALEPLLELPLSQLKQQLSTARAQIEAIREGSEVTALAVRIGELLREYNLGKSEHNEPIFNLESIRNELRAFVEQIDTLLGLDDTHEQLEIALFGRVLLQKRDDAPRRFRIFDRRALAQAGKAVARAQALELLAESHFLRRLLGTAEDASRHAIFLDICRVGTQSQPGLFSKDQPGFFSELITVYSTMRWFPDDGAILGENGAIEPTHGPPSDEDLARLRATRVVLKIVGLGALDYFSDEDGCHLWQPMRAPAEVVRVRVIPVTNDQSPAAYLAETRAAQEKFERALTTQGDQELPENPRGLLPLVRRLQFDLPNEPNTTFPIEIEDYRTGYSARLRVRSVDDALNRIAWLRMSHEDTP